MSNDSHYGHYVNQVQLPPSQSQIFSNVSATDGAARSSSSNQNDINIDRVPPSQPAAIVNNLREMVFEYLGPPPTYNEAIRTPNVDLLPSPPPTYDSLYGRLRQAQKRTNANIAFLKIVCPFFLGALILCIVVVTPVCMVVIGSMFLYQCPQGEYIPVYLLIGGIMGVIKPLLSLSTQVRQSADDQATLQASQSRTQTMINWFILGWFLIGSYWIYRIHEPNYDKSLGPYCNKTLYTFSFWLVSSVYIVVGIIVVAIFVISVLSIILHKEVQSDSV